MVFRVFCDVFCVFRVTSPVRAVNDYPKPHKLQFQGSRAAQWLLKAMGWRVEFDGFPTLQGIAVVYPHTSNWDAPIMFLVKWAVGVQVMFWGKDTLFKIPLLGAWLRWIGGVPVQRTSKHGVVGSMIEQMAEKKAKGEYFWLGLAPEGTRKYIPGWRSGFYRVAAACDVPLLVVTLDYSRRECKVNQFLKLSGNEAQDMAGVAVFCAPVRGLRPENMSPVALIEPKVDRSELVVK
jgi:1-acyl-sn-glycerol-3-phosphate acyltransferase